MSSTGSEQPIRFTRRDRLVLLLLSVVVLAISLVMVVRGHSSFLEAVAFASGVLCVWMGVKGSIWTFPLGLVNSATYFIVFMEARLYGDMALQVVYFAMNGMGWYMWLFGGEQKGALAIRHVGRRELAAVLISVPVIGIALWRTLIFMGGAASLGDAVTTSISLGGQWLMNRKFVENWHLWILADVLYVPLYISRGLHLTAVLYAAFLVMAVVGLLEWRAQARVADARV